MGKKLPGRMGLDPLAGGAAAGAGVAGAVRLLVRYGRAGVGESPAGAVAALLDWPLEREADLPIYLSADDNKLLLARFGNSSKPVR